MSQKDADGESVSAVFRTSFPEVESEHFQARFGARARSTKTVEALHPTMLHALAMAAKVGGDVGIVFEPEKETDSEITLSYQQIYDAAGRVAVALRDLGIERGDRVLIVLPTSPDFVFTFFGIQLIGAIPVPSYPPVMMEKLEVALERLQHVGNLTSPVLCITTRSLLPVLGALALGIKSMRDIVIAEKLASHQGERTFEIKPGPKDAALIQCTSGSTGNPKGVLLTHANVTLNVHAIGANLHYSEKDRLISWLPLYHDMGLIGALMSGIYWRLPLVLMSPMAFMLRPVRWLRSAQKHQATATVAPNFAYGMCVKRVPAADREGLDLSSVRVFLSGAEAVSLRTIIDFENAYAAHGVQKNRFVPVYGLAESTVAITFSEPGAPLCVETVDRAKLANGHVVPAQGAGSVSLVGVGKAIVGHEVLVVDAEGAEIDERRVGHIITRGTSVMREYFNAPETTAKVLKDGWLWTGDLGYVSHGSLFIAGRAKDMLIVRGRNYYAEDIEKLAERIPGVRAGGVVAFSVFDQSRDTEVPILVCETRAVAEQERQTIAAQVTEIVSGRGGLSLEKVVLVAPGAIPKTSSGKRQRSLTRERYLANALVPTKTGKLKLALVLAKSTFGVATTLPRQLRRRREPS